MIIKIQVKSKTRECLLAIIVLKNMLANDPSVFEMKSQVKKLI